MTTSTTGRLAIVGGGMGGVATAYFCDDGWSVDLFEERATLGGNATSLAVDDGGHAVVVDVGAESFNARTHPLYWDLLHELGVAPGEPDDVVVTMPGSLSVFDAATGAPLFVSRRALRQPAYAWGLLRFSRAARAYLAGDPSAELTVGEWFDRHAADRGFERDILLPWLASLTCYGVEALRQQSMLAFLLLFARIFPANPLRRPGTACARIGLGGVLAMLVDRCRNLTVHTGAPVSRVERQGGSWFVETPDGTHGPYEQVVVNAPPHASARFLAGVPDELLGTLERHTYYPARLVIHRDPVYMPRDRADWCTHNAAVDGDTCEASIWLGAFRTNPGTGEPVHLFKSWATRRAMQPAAVLAERTFLHPSLSPEALRATHALARWQGVDGLHFAGHFTTITDLQETALSSALAVARTVSPDGARLASFRHRVASAGHEHVGYDVALTP